MRLATANWPRLGNAASSNARPSPNARQFSPLPLLAQQFDAVRVAITLAAVLQLLGFKANSTHGAQQRGPCPLHGSTSGTSRCFSANLEKEVFHCFKCGCSGNALDLWAKANRLTVYDAAIDLCERLGIPLPTLPTPLNRNRKEEPVDSEFTKDRMETTGT
jgi:hypothetical protein